MSENTLAKKLANVMKEVKYIQKTGFNSFHKYKYATEADVNEKVREELAKQNVAMLPSMMAHEMRTHTNRNGATEYITCVDMSFTFVDGDSGESLSINMSGEGQDAGDKGIYKAIAGAQKYALMKVFMIPTGDDPEADEGVDERNHAPAKKSLQKAQTAPPQADKPKQDKSPMEKMIASINAMAREIGMADGPLHAFLEAEHGVKSIKQLSLEDGRAFYKKLKALKEG